MTDDDLEAMRARVARHKGAARTRPLLELGQGLMKRYWEAGPGSPAGAGHLDEAVTVHDEAYGHLEPAGSPRAMVAGLHGWLLGIRHLLHAGTPDDRERGISRIGEALRFPHVPPMLQITHRAVLGQLLLARVTADMQVPDSAMKIMIHGLSEQQRESTVQAIASFRQVADSPAANAEVASLAHTMIAAAEVLQNLGAGRGGGAISDLAGLSEAFSRMQNLPRMKGGASPFGGAASSLNPFNVMPVDVQQLFTERPVPGVSAAAPIRMSRQSEQAPTMRPSVPAATLRAALVDRLPGNGLPGLRALLSDGAPPLPTDTVDDLVALASSTVDARDSVGTDHLLLATALYLRGTADDGGWGDGGVADDFRAAAESLASAAEAVVLEPAETVAIGVRLAALLDEREDLGSRARLDEAFAPVRAGLRTAGADGLLYRSADQALLLSARTGLPVPAGPVLPDRLLVVGDGPLPQGSTSLLRSGSQLLALAARTPRRIDEAVTFVANPRGDRRRASMDTLLLRRAFHPASTGLGDTGEHVNGAGTPDEVRSRLDASLLRLGCGVTGDGGLELAGGVLTTDEIAAGPPRTVGGLAVLPVTEAGGDLLTEALLESRFTGVIQFRYPIPDDVVSIVHLMLHSELIDAGQPPSTAVAHVRRWLADPHRAVPGVVPPWLAGRAQEAGLADPAIEEAMVHHGL